LHIAITSLGGDLTKEEIHEWLRQNGKNVSLQALGATIETALLENIIMTGSSKKHYSIAPEDTSFEIESVTKKMIADSFRRLGASPTDFDDPETETISEEPNHVRAPPPHYKVGMSREKGMSRDNTNIPDHRINFANEPVRDRLPSDVRRYWAVESVDDGKGKKYSLISTEDSSAGNPTQSFSVGDPFLDANKLTDPQSRLSPVREKLSSPSKDKPKVNVSVLDSGMSVLDYAKRINRAPNFEGYIEPRANNPNHRSDAPSRRNTDPEHHPKRLASFSLPEIPEHPHERGSVDTPTKKIIADTLYNFAQRDSITLQGVGSVGKSEDWMDADYDVKRTAVTPSDPRQEMVINPLGIDKDTQTLLREHLLRARPANPLDSVDNSTRVRLTQTFTKLTQRPDRTPRFPTPKRDAPAPSRRRKRGSFTDSAVEEDVRLLIGLSLRNLANRGEPGNHTNALAGIRTKYDLKGSTQNEFKNPEILRPLIKPSHFPTPDKKLPFYNKSSGHSSPSTGAFSDNGLSSLLAKLDNYLENHRVLPMDIEHGLKERIAEIKVKREVQKLNELMKRHMSNMPVEIAQHHWRCFTSIKGSQMRIEQIEETLVNMNVTFDLKTSRGVPVSVKLDYWMKQYRNHLQSGMEATSLNKRLFHQSEHHLQKFDTHCFHSILNVNQDTYSSEEIACLFGMICSAAFGVDPSRWFGPLSSPGRRCCFF